MIKDENKSIRGMTKEFGNPLYRGVPLDSVKDTLDSLLDVNRIVYL